MIIITAAATKTTKNLYNKTILSGTTKLMQQTKLCNINETTL